MRCKLEKSGTCDGTESATKRWLNEHSDDDKQLSLETATKRSKRKRVSYVVDLNWRGKGKPSLVCRTETHDVIFAIALARMKADTLIKAGAEHVS